MTGCPLLLPASRCKYTGQPLQKTLAKTVAKKTPGPIAEKHRGTVAKNTGNRCKKNAPLPKKTAQAGKTPVWKYTGYRCTKKTPILFGTITFEHDLLVFVVQCFLCLFFAVAEWAMSTNSFKLESLASDIHPRSQSSSLRSFLEDLTKI